jgi:hypothetical protein
MTLPRGPAPWRAWRSPQRADQQQRYICGRCRGVLLDQTNPQPRAAILPIQTHQNPLARGYSRDMRVLSGQARGIYTTGRASRFGGPVNGVLEGEAQHWPGLPVRQVAGQRDLRVSTQIRGLASGREGGQLPSSCWAVLIRTVAETEGRGPLEEYDERVHSHRLRDDEHQRSTSTFLRR